MKAHIFTTLLLLAVAAFATAQTSDTNPYAGKYIYWDFPSDYKLAQAAEAYSAIDDMLLAYKPAVGIPLPRELALVSLDQLLHDTSNDATQPFYNFINTRMKHVLEDLDRPVTHGLRIYKLYNDGFIIKSPKAAVAIDLIPGGSDSKPFIADSVIYAIASKCDALFISHCHADHANLNIAKSFAARGKRVIAPKDLWVGIDPLIQPLAEHKETHIVFDDLDLTLHVLPGHQGDVYLATSGDVRTTCAGWTLCMRNTISMSSCQTAGWISLSGPSKASPPSSSSLAMRMSWASTP